MASKNLQLSLAAELLNEQNLPITRSTVQAFFDKAVTEKEQTDIRRIGRLLDQIDALTGKAE